jgi:hypothetical protein
MTNLLPALLNPFTSGPAAIGAGVALMALGSALGAAAKGGRVSAGSTQAVNSGTPVSISRLIVDPNGAQRDRVSRSFGSNVVAAAAKPIYRPTVLGIETPAGTKAVGVANSRYNAKGGR